MAMGLHHLRYFVAVAEERNMSRAAERLGIAQPSLSAQIKYLERFLGVSLFRRHPHGVELTRAGAMFLTEARAALTSADTAVALARMVARGQVGALKVGFIVGTMVEATSALVRAYRERHPGVRVEFAEYSFADPSAGLNTAEVDLGFLTLPVAHSGLEFLELFRVPRVAVMSASHRLAGREAIEVGELFDDPWIVADTADEVCRDFWLAAEHRGGVPARLGPSTRSLDKFMQLAVAGEVVGLAATWVQQAFDRPGLAFVPVTDIAPVVTALAWRPGAPNPNIDAFVEAARELSPPGA
jgi:DNA-binding transcriptional LysR family regulator